MGLHVVIADDIAACYIDGKDRRVICTIDGHLQMHAAIMFMHDLKFIMISKVKLKSLSKDIGQQITIHLIKDASEYRMEFLDEMYEVFDTDPTAFDYFKALTIGKQRTLLYMIGNIKNADTRIRKSLIIADHLTVNKGKIDYKMLNEGFKNKSKFI